MLTSIVYKSARVQGRLDYEFAVTATMPAHTLIDPWADPLARRYPTTQSERIPPGRPRPGLFSLCTLADRAVVPRLVLAAVRARDSLL